MFSPVLYRVAEGVAFERTVVARGKTVLETAPIDHSGTPPQSGSDWSWPRHDVTKVRNGRGVLEKPLDVKF